RDASPTQSELQASSTLWQRESSSEVSCPASYRPPALYGTVEPLTLGVRTERSAKETPAEVAKGAKNQENSFSCPYFVRAHLPARPDFDTVTTLCFKRSLR